MQIIPAILEKNPESLFFQIRRLSPYFKSFQIDIADGMLVPNRTVQIEELIGYLTYNESLMTNNLSLDFHLMVKDYESAIKKLSNEVIGRFQIRNIFVHFSLLPNYSLLTTSYPRFSFGLVLNPEDSVTQIAKSYELSAIPSIQIMSVHPGSQGSRFLPETLKKIEQLRLQDYRNKIYLDGAINQDTLPIISAQPYLPDYICPGSYFNKSIDLNKSVEILKKALEK